ncbi:Multidrug resistance-associated protein 5 [Chamberlinius hualienensis]
MTEVFEALNEASEDNVLPSNDQISELEGIDNVGANVSDDGNHPNNGTDVVVNVVQKVNGYKNHVEGDVDKSGFFEADDLKGLSEVDHVDRGCCSRYSEGIKTAFIPFRCGNKDKEHLGNQKLGFFNYVSMQWMDKWMWKAARKGVERNDVRPVRHRDGTYNNNQRLVRFWKEELEKRGPENASLMRVLARFNKFPLFLSALLMVLTCVLSFVGPGWILNAMLDYITLNEDIVVFNTTGNFVCPDGDQPYNWRADREVGYGLGMVAAMSITQFLRNCALSGLWVVGAHSGIWAQAAVQVLVYDKVLTIKTGGERLLAEVINYTTTDIERIYMSMQMVMTIVGTPFMWVLNVAYCYTVLGPWSILGNVMLLIYLPIMAGVGRKTSLLRIMAVRITDSRIRMMSQVLSNIKLIKMYAWEKSFADKIKDIRSREEGVLRKASFLQSISWTASPILVIVAPMCSFIAMIYTGHSLNASQAFPVISVFGSLLLPLNTLPMSIKSFSEGIISCRRIQKMLLTENASIPTSKHIANPNHAISIVNVDAAWEETQLATPAVQAAAAAAAKKLKKAKKDEKKQNDKKTVAPDAETVPETENGPETENVSETEIAESKVPLVHILYDISFTVDRGQLIGICGGVGSGKSSLLAIITGDTTITKGLVGVQGKLAFATQQAWIFNATVRENILFGLPYDEERYQMTVYACCLVTDFTLMPSGDMTEIGEKGANLSGGQKQRVNLARALYSNRDIYLLDDVLSAVDVKVGKHIFEHCIKRGLKDHGKTVLLVSHAMHLLERCDYNIVMKKGHITERGTHSELLTIQDGEYAQMYFTDQEERNRQQGEKSNDDADEEGLPDVNEAKMVDQGMVKDEIDQHKSLTAKTFLYYSRQCGGYFISIFAFMTIAFFNLCNIWNSVWMQTWTDAGCGEFCNNTCYDPHNISQNNDKDMYVIVYAASGVALIIFGIMKGFTVSRVMLNGSSNLHNAMFRKVLRSPMAFFDITPLGRIMARFSRDMDELDVQIPFVTEFCTQSLLMIAFQLILIGYYFPWYIIGLVVAMIIYFIFDALLNGGVRATKRVDNLLRPPLLIHMSTTVQGIPVIRCYEKQKTMAQRFRALVDKHISAYLLFQLSSKWIAFRIDTLSWFVITGTGLMVVLTKGTVSSGVAGMVMSQIFRVCNVLATVTRWKSELMARLISIERVAEYSRNLEEEAPAIIKKNRPPKDWPQKGSIRFENVELRYRKELPLVLHGLSVDIQGSEKVGIVGRTGAGKSSVIGTILRLTEVCGGKIIIDDIDISQIGLEDLRSKIAVIPQEPVLFEGTIRWNLDPFGEHTDEQMWDALEQSHLKTKIEMEANKLDTILSPEGGIFSLGEKQLFCLSRALLRNSQILLLDEATASVDVETDRLIQETIRTAFKGCTVLTIAHRINTIADYEKIMGMDAGKVVEFDTPSNLLVSDSMFHSMMKAMHEANED